VVPLYLPELLRSLQNGRDMVEMSCAGARKSLVCHVLAIGLIRMMIGSISDLLAYCDRVG